MLFFTLRKEMAVAYALLDKSQKHSSRLEPFPTNLGRSIDNILFKSAMIPFHVVISSLLSSSSHSFSSSHNSCRNSFILKVTGVIPRGYPKPKLKQPELLFSAFACSMFSSFFVHMENSSVFVFQTSPSTLVTLSFI